MPQATWSTQLGIALEATAGTAVPATAFIPAENIKVDDKITLVDDKAWRGAPVDIYDQLQGPTISDLSWDGPVYPDTIGFLLAGVLGADDVTGSAAPYAHKFTLNNTAQPKTYTITDAVNGSIRQAAGVHFSEVSFKIDPSQLVTYTAKGQGNLTATTTRPTASYSAVRGSLGWNFAAKLGGVASTLVESADVTITRVQTPFYTLGQQNPNIYDGIVSASVKLQMVMEDEAEITKFLASTSETLELSFTNGAGATQIGLDIVMSKAIYKTLVKDRSKDYVALQIEATALGNNTDVGASGGFSPLSVTVTNAIAAGAFM